MDEVDLGQRVATSRRPGRTLLLVRDGAAVLGEVLHDDPAALSDKDLRLACAAAVADALAARSAAARTTRPAAHTAADVTAVVCTRDRPDLLRRCLTALLEQVESPGEVLVVDSASRGSESQQAARALGVRVVREDVPGLDRARNRGWQEASSSLVAYVDDDAVADRHWVGAVARGFFDPAVGMLTGLVLPAEVSTRAQRLFERHGGMRRGLERRTHHRDVAPLGLAVEQLGVGTNMAYRRDVLASLGGFDPCLDVGTSTGGGGDLEMFHRVLVAGQTAVYEPDAVVRHQHRRDFASWWRQMDSNGRGYDAYLEAVAVRHPEHASEVRRHRRAWHWRRHGKGLVRALVTGQRGDALELLAEARGSLAGRAAYRHERRRASPTLAGPR